MVGGGLVAVELYALVPFGVVTVTKYCVPSVAPGETAVSEVPDGSTDTFVAGRSTLSLLGAPPDSSTKVTVEPLTKPVPVIVTVVPPAIEPVAGLMLVTLGTVGDQTQLSTVIVVPQKT
jgi:hypothetical protein